MSSKVPKISVTQRQQGSVYTPTPLALWLLGHASTLGLKPRLVLDPAAGKGSLLNAGREVYPSATFLGFERDPKALSFLSENGLAGADSPVDSLLNKWGLKGTKNLVIANPPWGAFLTETKKRAYGAIFENTRGQYDSYDLFVEKIVRELPQGSHGAIFLPDSILLPQHAATRSLLTKFTTLLLISRLGEGAFPGVNMGSMAIIFKKGAPGLGHIIQCTKIVRSEFVRAYRISEKETSLIAEPSHGIPQSRFLKSKDCNWTLELKEKIFSRALKSAPDLFDKDYGQNWRNWFETSRGIEIGKAGVVWECHKCGLCSPPPKSGAHVRCLECSSLVYDTDQISIFRPLNQVKAGSFPILAGEDLSRYRFQLTRRIDSNVKGVNFKTELRSVERLAIRKTGIGIHASVIPAGLATTQTIYSFSPRKLAPVYALRYVEGLMCSRIYTALHLSRSGDLQWKSHPYVTQALIQSLPLPIPAENSALEFIAIEIARLSTAISTGEGKAKEEMELESLVCQALDCDDELMDWAFEVLGRVTGSSHVANLYSTVTRESSRMRVA